MMERRGGARVQEGKKAERLLQPQQQHIPKVAGVLAAKLQPQQHEVSGAVVGPVGVAREFEGSSPTSSSSGSSSNGSVSGRSTPNINAGLKTTLVVNGA